MTSSHHGSPAPARRGARIAVAPQALQPNRWNPNDMDDNTRRKVRASLARFGQVAEILVRRVGPDNPADAGRQAAAGLEIINGEHRWQEAVAMGMAAVDVRDLGIVPDAEAQQLTIVLNGLTGSPDPELLGKLIEALVATDGIEALEAVLPYSAAEIDGLAKLSSVDPYFSDSSAVRSDPNARPDGVAFKYRDSGKTFLPIAVGSALLKEFDVISREFGTRDIVVILEEVARRVTAECIEAAWERILVTTKEDRHGDEA